MNHKSPLDRVLTSESKPPQTLNDIATTRSALQSACDPLGKPELLKVLTQLEQAVASAQTGVQAVREAGGLLEFHSALVDLRACLEPLRNQVIQYEDEVGALFWSRAASPPGVEAVLTVIRAYRRALDDLIFYLPYRRPASAGRSPPAQAV